ncbi:MULTISPECIES: chromosome segregation protein SMC [unclassified Sphingomonas]|uniref:chromosome segregation protein SMC n=1 Tax=unclassified Sphingomonas TaxID=196159 RepID=UPI000927E666|nr:MULTISPECIES: chromosome segregation protein SMC [unclassified Sphingomonas]MBN8846800.1 chromosome segregation protein SMC [Sphingomonas sp.]OJV33799.1 MAG: chromosome segregation protein SMC [Sphingomonas sp. 67-36]
MQIKRLRLSGFKSFVDPADLRIEPGLTGVVGPNGCGKSNLLEALRWTMGENSPKSMRGAGMEDVIFAGTATRPARDFAEVSILAELDGEEKEVVRRIERGAGSAYRIDGRDVRAKDVALLFADAATGAHSPALVSQGRISAVIAAKPAERRAMLEEAAGIAGLHVRRKDAEQKLRATEANLQRLDEVIADQEARAAALRRQARQAERYRTLSDQIRVAEARLIFSRWRDAAQAADAAKAEAAEAETRVATAAETQRAAAAYQTQATETLAEARAAALAARDRATDAAHRLAALNAEKAGVERRLAELSDAATRILADREREGQLANDAAEALARLGAEGKALETEVTAVAADLPALDQAQAEAEREVRDAEVALAQALARQASEAAETRVAHAALAAARARADRADREARTAADTLAALPDAAPLEAGRVEAEQALAAAHGEATRARDDLTRADEEEKTALAARDEAQGRRAAARAELAALESEATTLTRATQRSGGDRLLDHVRAAPGYERALAAALGDDLEIGLDASAEAHWAGAEVLAGDPVLAETLAAHVTAPPQLARRLAQVIATPTDDARPLAVGQRLVTLSGQLRRWDGFVARSGGAAAAERLERLNRLATIEAALPEARAATDAADAALAAIEQRIAAARAAAGNARTSLSHAETAARDAQQRIDRAVTQIERLAGQRTDLTARAAQTAAERDAATAEVTQAEAAIVALPDTSATAGEVASLQREAEARRAAVAQSRADRAARERAGAVARERLAASQTETKSWKNRAGDAARRIADMAKREAEIAQDRETLAPRPAALAEEIATVAAEHDAARASAETLAAAEREAESALRRCEEAGRIAGEALGAMREARAGAQARAENQELRRIELGRLSGERFECPAPVLPTKAGFDSATVRAPQEESAAHDKLTLDRERIGPVNLVAEQELAELEAGAIGNAAEREELGLAVNQLRGSIGTLNREGRQRLLAAFEAVNGHFKRLFTTLFNGGQAHLELIDSDDPLEAGLEIMAQPPGKRLQSLTLLSGGEQALTAVALIFGLFLTNPAPICVLDEVDAPLDDANIERFCDLLDRMTQETRTRYLIVTHNAVTMSRMHRLFGVTMIERGVSRLVSVDLQAAETLLAAE